jgi:hypothetical protein
VIPTSALAYTTYRWLADAAPATVTVGSSNPTLTIFATLLGGGIILALVGVYKARAERGTVVASGSEKAVLSMERSLAAMEKRAMSAETRADSAERRETALEQSLEQARVTAEALVTQIESSLTNARQARNTPTT